MRFRRLAIGSIGTVSIGLVTALTASAATAPAATAIRLTEGHGFVAIDEQRIPGGAVIGTFRSADATVRVLGSPGASLAIAPTATATRDTRRSLRLTITRPAPKTLAGSDAYRRSGRTVVGDLVALGVPRDEATARFADMETLSGAPRTGTLARQRTADLESRPQLATSAATPSTTTPYDNQCATISAAGGKIEGYGCSTLFLVSASGGDWWFSNKYKLSARSTDTSWFHPQRLFEAGWSLGWATHNDVYEWQPEATINRNDCGNVNLTLGGKGGSISVAVPVCPTRLEPWNLGLTQSGAIWRGIERGTEWEAAGGLQLVHSPASASANHSSTFALTFGGL